MTKSEKTIFAILIFFLFLGISIRLARNSSALVDYRVSRQEFRLPALHSNKIKNNFKTIDINQAQLFELERLPGIGPKSAQAIVDYRNKFGRFKKIEDLRKIKFFGKSRFEKVKKMLSVSNDNLFKSVKIDKKNSDE